MENKFKELDIVYYVDHEKNKVVKALWWNWSSRCIEPELDVICINLARKESKSGFRLGEDELLRVDIKKIFKTQEEADNLLSSLSEKEITPKLKNQ